MRRWVAVGMLLAAGCQAGTRTEDKPMLPMTQVPRMVRSVAYSQNPKLRFHTAWRLPGGGYQLRGLDPAGKNVDVLYSADGSALRAR